MTKDFVKYSTTNVEGGKQSTVSIDRLPNYLADMTWAGEVCSSEKLSINSAAAVALEAIMNDPELKELYDAVKPPKLGPHGEPLKTKRELKDMRRGRNTQDAEQTETAEA